MSKEAAMSGYIDEIRKVICRSRKTRIAYEECLDSRNYATNK